MSIDIKKMRRGWIEERRRGGSGEEEADAYTLPRSQKSTDIILHSCSIFHCSAHTCILLLHGISHPSRRLCLMSPQWSRHCARIMSELPVHAVCT